MLAVEGLASINKLDSCYVTQLLPQMSDCMSPLRLHATSSVGFLVSCR